MVATGAHYAHFPSLRQDASMARAKDTPQLPVDWSSMDEQTEQLAREQELIRSREVSAELLRSFDSWLREEAEAEPDDAIATT